MKRLLPVALALSILLPALPAKAGIGTEIYDARGKLVTVARGKSQNLYVPLAQIPQVAREAVIAIEDSRFYEHHGVDLRGLARAIWTDLRTHGKAEGASTITMQLVKEKYLTAQKTWSRKIDQAMMALDMERKYSKDQILEMYLNESYWGHGAIGIEAASETYFGHSARTLDLAESAVLAGLLKGPEHYSPYHNYHDCIERQHVVLERMAELGIIRQDEAERAKRVRLRLPGAPGEAYHAGYFTSYLVNQLIAKYGTDAVMRGDMKVQSTMDLETQEEAENMVSQLVSRYGPRYHFDQAAMVALNPTTGAILAMVGGSSYKQTQYNRAIFAHRQPGSTFKPFVYLTAFSKGVSATATMSDKVVTYMVNGHAYAPHNYQGEKEGTMSLRRALELSNNVVTIKLLDEIKPESVVETARRIGITSPLRPTLSLGLGTYEVTPLELASAYGVFAANGVRNEPIAYWNVRDGSGRVLEEHHPTPQRVFEEAPIRLLTDCLRGVITRGTGTAANIGRPVAGKTGTTNDSRDAWFVGYTPQVVVALWVGNDNNHKMVRSAAGGVVAAPTWGRFMKAVLKRVPVVNFQPPVPISVPKATASVLTPASSATVPAVRPSTEPPAPEPDAPMPDQGPGATDSQTP